MCINQVVDATILAGSDAETHIERRDRLSLISDERGFCGGAALFPHICLTLPAGLGIVLFVNSVQNGKQMNF